MAPGRVLIILLFSAIGASEAAAQSCPFATIDDCPAGFNRIVGTGAAQTLTGTAGPDCILGLGGNDTINGGGGNDIICGGLGGDTINGGDGDDIIYGDDGTDKLNGDAGADQLFGGDGTDTLSGGDGPDQIYGGEGTDRLAGGSGNDFLDGGAGGNTVDGGADTDVCVNGTPSGCESLTPASLSRVRADLVKGRVRLRWSTEGEAGTLRYEVRRRGRDGLFRTIPQGDVPALHGSDLGGEYELADRGPARPGDRLVYEIVEHGAGVTQTHGPFEVIVDELGHADRDAGGEGLPAFEQRPWSRRAAALASDRAHPHDASGARALAPRRVGRDERGERDHGAGKDGKDGKDERAPGLRDEQCIERDGDHELGGRTGATGATGAAGATGADEERSAGHGLKIGVGQTGMVRVSTAELAAELGEDEDTVREWLAHRRLLLSTGGAPVAWWSPPDRSGLVFYGLAPTSPYAAHRVYFLSGGSGPVMRREGARSTGRAPVAASFAATIHAEEERFPGLVAEPNPEGDIWFWSVLMSGFPGYDVFKASLAVDALSPQGEAELRARLFGASIGTHTFSVRVNGTIVGEATTSSTGEGTIALRFDAALLVDGANSVEIRVATRRLWGASIAYVDDLELSYPRAYRGNGSQLEFDAAGPSVIDVTEPGARLFDITDPVAPVLLETPGAPAAADTRLRFSAPREGARYLVVENGAWRAASFIRPHRPSSLLDDDLSAEYVVIAPKEHVAAARRLAAERREAGLTATVVDVEDIYDELGDGAPSPHAVRAFLRHAVGTWEVPPRYVVLAGSGSYDARDVYGWGEALVPTFMVRTGSGLYASDTLLADVVGDDGLPDLAIGRLPATSAVELEQMIDKIVRYERTGGRAGGLTLVADGRDGAVDFDAGGDVLLDGLPGWSRTRLYVDDVGASAARTGTALAFGEASILTYLGHGSVAALGKRAALLATADVAALPSTDTPPLVLGMTCTMGRFELPGYDGLAEALVARPDGGAIAVLSASALSEHPAATAFVEALLSTIAGAGSDGGGARLGDEILAAQSRLSASGDPPAILRTYNLLGDPALRLRAP